MAFSGSFRRNFCRSSRSWCSAARGFMPCWASEPLDGHRHRVVPLPAGHVLRHHQLFVGLAVGGVLGDGCGIRFHRCGDVGAGPLRVRRGHGPSRRWRIAQSQNRFFGLERARECVTFGTLSELRAEPCLAAATTARSSHRTPRPPVLTPQPAQPSVVPVHAGVQGDGIGPRDPVHVVTAWLATRPALP